MRKVAFVFPGQGSQYRGMGREFYETYKSCQKILDSAGEILGWDLKDKIFNGSDEDLQQTEVTQPAVFTVSILCLEILREKAINPVMVAGHSLGEYSALVAAGALDFADCLKLVRKRAEFIQKASAENPGTMAAIIGLDAGKVKEICDQTSGVEAVNFNSPGQIVIAGTSDGCQKAVEIAENKGARKAVVLKVSGPFHSKLMSPARRNLKDELEKYNINDPQRPVVTNYNSEPTTTGAEIKEALINQINSPVLWEASVSRMIREGINVFIEVGPGKVLTGLLRRISKDVIGLNVEDEKSLEKTLSQVQ